MSRDVTICNILFICRKMLNRENWEVLYPGKTFISNTLSSKNLQP